MVTLPCLIVWMACLSALRPPSLASARQVYRSPDGKLAATVMDVNGAHESRLEIRQFKGKLLLVQDYSSDDMEHGEAICKGAWTPDGEFFVFSMTNTGGHSPLGRPTWFYSRQRNRLYDLDLAIGYITTCNFTLQAPDWLTTEVHGNSVRVALSKLVK